MDHWSNVFPVIFLPLKFLVLAVGGYFAIKWHFDEDKRVKAREAKEKKENNQKNTDC